MTKPVTERYTYYYVRHGRIFFQLVATVSEFLTVGFSLLRHPADPIIRKSVVAAFAFR